MVLSIMCKGRKELRLSVSVNLARSLRKPALSTKV